MEADIVEDDDIAERQGRDELRFDPGLENAPVYRCIDDKGRDQPMRSEAGDEGLGLPRAKGGVGAIALPFCWGSRAPPRRLQSVHGIVVSPPINRARVSLAKSSHL